MDLSDNKLLELVISFALSVEAIKLLSNLPLIVPSSLITGNGVYVINYAVVVAFPSVLTI